MADDKSGVTASDQEISTSSIKVESETEVCGELANKKENGQENTSDVKPVKVENEAKANDEVLRTAEDNNDPDLESKIVRQIEYYFGDINLPRDKFLQEQIKLDDGWVPLKVMLLFNRLKMLSSKPETIVACLQSSSSLIEVSEDKTKIRRLPSKPLPDVSPEYLKHQLERSVYCKGFPQSLDDIDKLSKFFASFGDVENISIRRYKDPQSPGNYVFKGSVYVLFRTKELADKFLARESVKYEDKELLRMTKSAHIEEQKRERDERWGKKVKPKKSEDNSGKSQYALPKGCLFKVSPIVKNSTSRDEIKEAITAHGVGVAFIQYEQGDTEAIVRLQSNEDGAAVKFLQSLEETGESIKISNKNNMNIKLTQLEGDEEEAFLERTRQAFAGKNNQRGGSKRGRNKGGRGNFHGKRGHKRAASPIGDTARPAKQAAV